MPVDTTCQPDADGDAEIDDAGHPWQQHEHAARDRHAPHADTELEQLQAHLEHRQRLRNLTRQSQTRADHPTDDTAA